MCTAMTLQTKEGEVFFGRNMDFSYEIDPHFFRVPKSYQWNNALTGARMQDDYSFIGIGVGNRQFCISAFGLYRKKDQRFNNAEKPVVGVFR